MFMFLGPVGIAFLLGIMVGWAWKPRGATLANCIFDSSAPMVKNQCLGSSSIVEKEENHVPKDDDLKQLWHLVERKDGGPPWKHMMDRSTHGMHYQAWQRDPETGPPQYCSKTVYENATPELMREFFWDDEFRLKWDDMLLHAATIDEFPTKGVSIVHWIRKAACEVTFFHHEDMGIPWEIAKLGVRQGMWGAAKKVGSGFRSYQKERAISKTISPHVVMAQMSTKIDENHLASTLESDDMEGTQVAVRQEKPAADMMVAAKLLVIGGAIIFASSIDCGLLTKALISGVARRFASIGRRP
ncbi:hypothetical protein L6452_14969 [Arctium lappa]|uniref:Uncharacterized protein n=1 Tax=Arctium lappa TaxID=4217 RepID=A0ACB9CMP7_ARCLA|nr:hypothetical protein L6452_14969 [Arctium lappa]